MLSFADQVQFYLLKNGICNQVVFQVHLEINQVLHGDFGFYFLL
nr:MAG TPA: hypothetical protein [Caudoviricetes sp.]DAO95622.1 MAG TPA: hypothetical protein [Caudoviricetes sp.]